MIFYDIVFAFIIALIISILLSAVFGWRWPGRESNAGGSIAVLFLILFLLTWAGGIWIEPFGPTWAGFYWLPFIIVGIFFALLIAAFLPPPRRPRTRRQALEQAEARAEAQAVAETAIGIFFWIIVILLIGAIIARYA